MPQVAWATEPGSPDRPNEDFVAAAPGAVVVLDGCSLPLGMDLGCAHGTAWYSRNLGRRLLSRMLRGGSGALAADLAGAIADVAAMHAGSCDLTHPHTPASTVVALRTIGGSAEYLVLADSTLVLHNVGGLDVLTTPIAPGYAAARPAVAGLAITGEAPLDGLRRAVLMTDGASRPADMFHTLDWRELVHLVAEYGPQALIERTRDTERSDPDGARWPRGKRHDDATVALCAFPPPAS